MRRLRLNLNARAWRNLRRAWHPAPLPEVLWQSFVVGPVLSAANALQLRTMQSIRARTKLEGGLVILGYWRSGTTLLHELLAASCHWSVPTTYACMNPNSFALAPAPADLTAAMRRPMDDMVVHSDSPQEGEFALLGLGARSPYEALLFPERLADALALADPDELPPGERQYWYEAFRAFVGNVAAVQGGKPPLLKSPAHSCRIAALRTVLPGCRFVVIVRNPYEVFESTVRMWHRLFACYALTRLPSDEAVRETVLAHRPGFEKKLQAGLEHLAVGEHASVHFEDLIASPAATVAKIYGDLRLEGAEEAVRAAEQEAARRARYSAQTALPPPPWQEKVRIRWTDLFERYGYPV